MRAFESEREQFSACAEHRYFAFSTPESNYDHEQFVRSWPGDIIKWGNNDLFNILLLSDITMPLEWFYSNEKIVDVSNVIDPLYLSCIKILVCFVRNHLLSGFRSAILGGLNLLLINITSILTKMLERLGSYSEYSFAVTLKRLSFDRLSGEKNGDEYRIKSWAGSVGANTIQITVDDSWFNISIGKREIPIKLNEDGEFDLSLLNKEQKGLLSDLLLVKYAQWVSELNLNLVFDKIITNILSFIDYYNDLTINNMSVFSQNQYELKYAEFFYRFLIVIYKQMYQTYYQYNVQYGFLIRL